LPLRKIAYQRQFKALALQGFDHQHQPDREETESYHQGRKQHQQLAHHRDKGQDQVHNPERGTDDQCRQPQSNALKGMKAHEAIFVVGFDQKKNDCRNNRAVGQRTGYGLRQRANVALHALDRAHGAAATRTERSGIRHGRGTLGAGNGHEVE